MVPNSYQGIESLRVLYRTLCWESVDHDVYLIQISCRFRYAAMVKRFWTGRVLV